MIVNQWRHVAAIPFKYRHKLKAAVEEARTKKRYGLRDELKANPTQEHALQHCVPIKSVTIRVGRRGYELTVHEPEKWLQVVNETYWIYENTLVGDIMQAYYDSFDTYPRKPDVISGLRGISRSTFYAWRSEFLEDAVLIASRHGLIENK